MAFVASLMIVLIPSWRDQVQRGLLPPVERQILSSVTGDILRDGQLFEVLKVRSSQGLFLEIYRRHIEDGGRSPLVDRIRLPDLRDGHFNFRGQSVNLALEDVNGDGQMEIIAPTFDERLTAHLNVYRFNPDLEVFEPLRRPESSPSFP